jgi:aspartate carbamoyltransferase regulatory subunit
MTERAQKKDITSINKTSTKTSTINNQQSTINTINNHAIKKQENAFLPIVVKGIRGRAESNRMTANSFVDPSIYLS